MSPIAFPDLLQERAPNTTTGMANSTEERGRKSASSRLISGLRSRSRSATRARRSKSAQRRAASLNPTDRRTSSTKEVTEKKRSLSRPSRRPKEITTTKEDKYVIKAKKPLEAVEVKRTSKSSSPTKRRPSKMQQPDQTVWGADIINLVDRDLDDVLRDDVPKSLELKKKSSKDNKIKRKTSSNSGGSNHHHESPKGVNGFPSTSNYSDDEEFSDDDSDEEDEDEDNKSVDAKDLLAQVQSRMEQQRLMEEVKELRRVVEKKDAEIEQLTGQLRMAISTKCDLVIAHTELERLHEMDLKERDQFATYMKRSNLELLEVRAEVEKEFMNELTGLSKQVAESEQRREEDNKEKDETIRLLEDKIKRMERMAIGASGASARPDTDKVRFYKKKLGVSDQ